MMKRKLLLAIIGSVFFAGAYAQVGIGNPSPNAGSILDLTNSNNKALLLPISNTAPSSVGTFNTEGMLFYYQSNLHLKLASGIKVITPWNYDGTATNGMSSPSGTPIGIGIAPLVSSTAILTVADAAGDVNVTGSNASIVVGDNDFNATHLLIDEDEILVKTNATTAGTLKLMEEGGTVVVRSSGADAGVTTVLTAYGSVDAKGKLKENGNDLLPVGSIIMWSGTTIPAGWALCDGGSYALMDGSGNVTTPNLMDRFIVGSDLTGGTGAAVGSYTVNTTGGNNSITLSIAQLPAHNHTGTTNNDGAHQHTSQPKFLADNDDNDDTGYYVGQSGGSDPQGQSGTHDITNSGSSHTHNFTTNNTGSGSSINIVPYYYALAYLFKL